MIAGSRCALQSARTIGGAGTGKTRELIEIVAKLLDRLGDPYQIGFVSFTRAARQEAAERAAIVFGLNARELMQGAGWFRTLHSVCYRLLASTAKAVDADSKWLAETFDQQIAGGVSTTSEELAEWNIGQTDVDRALNLWGLARNRLMPVEPLWTLARQIDASTPDLAEVERIVERYEQAKRLDGRCDYTDMLARFAGYRFDMDGPAETGVEGDVPGIQAWILDEAQDTSPLAGKVFDRLISAPSVRWVYLAGDPMQAIFTFAGSDHRVFLDWPVVAERTAKKSWRCPRPILDLGELILKRCSDYWDRGIAPADHEGSVERIHLQKVLAGIRPDESWLVLTRARYMANSIKMELDRRAVPWHPVKGNGGWNAPKRNAATATLISMERGAPIGADEWPAVLSYVKMDRKINGQTLLIRGTKAKWAKMKRADFEEIGLVPPARWDDLGITKELAELITSGQWRQRENLLVPYAARYYDAVRDWGYRAPEETKVRVGTIHSSKGMEADNVLLLTTTTARCEKAAMADTGAADAEHRVWYVGVTRARKKLYLAREDAVERGQRIEYEM